MIMSKHVPLISLFLTVNSAYLVGGFNSLTLRRCLARAAQNFTILILTLIVVQVKRIYLSIVISFQTGILLERFLFTIISSKIVIKIHRSSMDPHASLALSQIILILAV